MKKKGNVQRIPIPIDGILAGYLENLKPLFAGMIEDITEENLQARIRGMILMALSNKTGAIVLTTNKAFKHWPSIFNNDSTLTSAILDRLLHHAETVVIEGKSYRMKDRIEP